MNINRANELTGEPASRIKNIDTISVCNNSQSFISALIFF